MEWEISYYSESLQNELVALPTGIQARYLRLADRMRRYGPNLGMPHTRALPDGLFEIRAKSKEGIGRVFYCTLAGKRIVILDVCIKKSEKTPPHVLERAYSRMKEVKQNADPR